MAKQSKPKTQHARLTAEQIQDRTESHPAAVPFLWLGDQKVIDNFYKVPLLGTILFSLLGWVYPLHHPAPWDVVPFSYAVFGFCAYSFVVLASWPLFKLLGRPEDYYGEGEEND